MLSNRGDYYGEQEDYPRRTGALGIDRDREGRRDLGGRRDSRGSGLVERDEYGREYAGEINQSVDAYGNPQRGHYDVYQTRGPASRREGRDDTGRDGMTSYGAHSSPRVGLGSIDYSHDVTDPVYKKPHHNHRHHHNTTRRVETVVERDYPVEYTREPEYTTTTSRAVTVDPREYSRNYSRGNTTGYTTSTYNTTRDLPDSDYDTTTYTSDFVAGPSYETTYSTTGVRSAREYVSERRGKSGRRKWNPICDMGETDKYWLVRCEIPGVRKDRLKVEVEGKDLIIKGKRVKELWNLDKLGPRSTTATESTVSTKTSEEGNTSTSTSGAPAKFQVDERMNAVRWLDKERGGKGTFKRRIRLPERVDNSAIQALYKDGILEVLVKKPEVQEVKQAKANAKAVPIHD